MDRKRVLLRGASMSQSGYGVHIRQIAKWLLSRSDCDVSVWPLPWGITTWYIDPDACDGLIGELMRRSTDKFDPNNKFDISFQVQLPNEWDSSLAKVNIGVTAGIETDVCNPAWIADINKMNIVVVPSTHVRDTFMRTSNAITTPIVVIPEAYITAIDALDVNHDNQANSLLYDMGVTTPFNFLLFGQITGDNPESDRKNTFYAIKWLCETFSDDEDVGIIIKTNMGRSSQIDKKRTTDLLTNVINSVRVNQYPRFHLIHGQLTDTEIASIYTDPCVRAAVSLTRGEGYGLPLVEAAAAGLPIIATDWSGHLDFLNKGKFIKLNYTLKPIHKTRVDNVMFVQNAKWAEVEEEDVKRKLRKFRSSSTMPKEWATELSKIIRREFSFDAVSKQYDALFDGLK